LSRGGFISSAILDGRRRQRRGSEACAPTETPPESTTSRSHIRVLPITCDYCTRTEHQRKSRSCLPGLMKNEAHKHKLEKGRVHAASAASDDEHGARRPAQPNPQRLQPTKPSHENPRRGWAAPEHALLVVVKPFRPNVTDPPLTSCLRGACPFARTRPTAGDPRSPRGACRTWAASPA